MEREILIYGRKNMFNQICYHCHAALLFVSVQSIRVGMQKHYQYPKEVSVRFGKGEETPMG